MTDRLIAETGRKNTIVINTGDTLFQTGELELEDKKAEVGKDRCMECHEETVVSWAKTAHARALDSLIRKGKEYDPQCLPCHVTGMNDKSHDGGFISLNLTPHMVNVQCEQCHGPGGLHAQKPENASARLSGAQTCLSCHTKDTDPGLSYQKKQKTGIH